MTDGDHASGRVGMYSWGNDGAIRVTLRAYPAAGGLRAVRDRFAAGDVTPWTSSTWVRCRLRQVVVAGGKLRQTSNLHSMPVAGADPDKEGTYAVAGSSGWSNVVIQIRLEAHDDDAIGFMFRFIDGDNYYRFSMDRERGYRRLVRKEKGVFEVLWEDDFAFFELARSYQFTVIADSEELRGFSRRRSDVRRRRRAVTITERSLCTLGPTEDARFSDVRVYTVSPCLRRLRYLRDLPCAARVPLDFPGRGALERSVRVGGRE